MALPVWQGTSTDELGNIVAGAEILVVNEATGLDADLFSDRAGLVGITNPFFAGSNGFAQFYTAAGEYRVISTNTATTDTNTWRYTVLSGTAAIRNTGTASDNVPLNSDLGTASTKDVQSSPSDSAAGAVLNNETTHIGGNINYTEENFQPDIVGGLNTAKRFRNQSGSAILSGATVSGNLIREFTANASGSALALNAMDASHIYRNTMGITINDTEFGDFARIS